MHLKNNFLRNAYVNEKNDEKFSLVLKKKIFYNVDKFQERLKNVYQMTKMYVLLM